MADRFGFGNYRYEVVPGWSGDTTKGVVSDVATDSRDRVYLAVRNTGGPAAGGAILVFDRNGKMLDSWGQDLFTTPHGIWIGPNDEVLLADSNDHTVRKYTPSGELRLTLGTKGETGAPGAPFNRPTRAALTGAGDLFVSDGYGQDRVHRFTGDGELVLSFGETGKGPGRLNLPHDVTVGGDDRVYVLDRENRRCQVFDQEGGYITEIEGLRSPNDMVIDGDGFLHVAEGWHQEIASVCVISPEGEIAGRWGGRGEGPGYFAGAPHGLWFDSHGDMYVAEVAAEEAVHKFARI